MVDMAGPKPLTVAVAQPVSTLHDVEANVARHAAAIRRAEARLVVFPELSLTGYSMRAPTVAVDDARLEPLVDACAATGTVALVGAPTPAPAPSTARPSIAVLVVDGEGVRVGYRKMNLGAEEAAHFQPGSSPSVIEVDKWRLGLAVCKDTGVPSHAALTATVGMDAYVAGVCEHGHDWQVPATRAARIIAEHAVWVVVAGFAGPTGGGFDDTAGRSSIWRPDGSAAVTLSERPDEIGLALLAP
jgi:predicted amidohydrolase